MSHGLQGHPAQCAADRLLLARQTLRLQHTLRFGGSASFRAAFRPAIIVSGYGQPSQPGWGFPRPETHHRERCDHRQMRRDAFERQHGFDPFADDCEIVANAETRAISENGARCCGAGTSRMGLVWRLSIRSASFLRINRHGKDDRDFSNSKNRGALEIFCHPIEKRQRDQGSPLRHKRTLIGLMRLTGAACSGHSGSLSATEIGCQLLDANGRYLVPRAIHAPISRRRHSPRNERRTAEVRRRAYGCVVL